ncbi:MAG: ornithine carbamoyltransferase [Deltaproteobacteria bacterium DG_8]|nr:MAG: ornithine carbamoyltransferase [Deltaproteobacteria bacterium DG_8]
MKKDLLNINSLSRQEIEELILRASSLKKSEKAGRSHHPLKGKTLGMLFEKPSTRTRVSFEVGMLQLGGHALYMSWKDTQLGREESVEDMARVLSRYLDGMVIRTFSQRNVETFAQYATIPVINGLTDLLHPCQVLSDLMSIVEKKGDYQKLKISYIGDGNNVANSWINASLTLGFYLHLACPKGYEPDQQIVEKAKKHLPLQIRLSSDPFEAAQDADIINTDTWVSMGQENERQKRMEVFKNYQVNSSLLKVAKKDVLVMHCLPAHRGKEITDEVADGRHSIIFDQAENRLHMQKAILEMLLTEK